MDEDLRKNVKPGRQDVQQGNRVNAPPRIVTCPTCHGEFPAGEGMISVCPRCAERVLLPALDDDDDEVVDLPAADEEPIASVPIVCKLCSSRYYATPQQVGDMLPCPDCHTFNVVADPESLRKPAAPEIPILSDDEDFKLSEPVDTPRYQALSRDALHFERAIRSEEGLDVKPVEPASPLALPSESDSSPGSESLADTATFVKRPAPGYGTMDSEEDAYSLAEPTPPRAYAPIEHDITARPESSLPSTTPSAPAAPLDQPARPQAATITQAPAAPAAPSSPARPDDIVLFPEDLVPIDTPAPPPANVPEEEEVIELGDDEPQDPRPPEVRLAPPEQRAEYRPLHRLPQPDDPDDKDDGSDFTESMKKILPKGLASVTRAAENFNPYESMKELPPEIAVKRPFSSGIFTFLFQPWVLMRWLFLVVLMTIELWASGYVLSLVASGDGGMLSAVAQIMGLLIYVAALLPAIIGAAIIGATSITILEETANGRDRIEGGGEFLAFEWLGGMIYVFAAGFVAASPTALLVLFLNSLGLNAVLVALLLYPTVFLLFPPILLSMLESDTVLTPLTQNMMRSFLPLLRFWAIFYGLSLLLGLLGIVFLFLAYTFGVISIVVAAAVTTAIPFLYFRLLGRMAMVYRDYVLATTPDEEEEDDQPRTARHAIR